RHNEAQMQFRMADMEQVPFFPGQELETLLEISFLLGFQPADSSTKCVETFRGTDLMRRRNFLEHEGRGTNSRREAIPQCPPLCHWSKERREEPHKPSRSINGAIDRFLVDRCEVYQNLTQCPVPQ